MFSGFDYLQDFYIYWRKTMQLSIRKTGNNDVKDYFCKMGLVFTACSYSLSNAKYPTANFNGELL